jgi:hypothetical protein
MAGKTISSMLSGGSIDGTELIEISQGGSTRKLSLATIKNWFLEFVNQATITAKWRYSTTTVASDPGNQKFRLNNILPNLATNIYIDDFDKRGIDMGGIIGQLRANDRMIIQQANNANNNLYCRINGTPTDNIGWWTIPINNVQDNGIWENNKDFGFIMFFI